MMTLVSIENNLINMDAVSVVEKMDQGIRIRYIGGYQTKIDCVDYDVFVKWAKENVADGGSYQDGYESGYEKGVEDGFKDTEYAVSETRENTILNVIKIVSVFTHYDNGAHREIVNEILDRIRQMGA